MRCIVKKLCNVLSCYSKYFKLCMVLVMKRARTFMIVFIVETIGVLMFLGCSSPKNKKTSDAPMDTAMIYEDMPQETSVSKVGINSSQSTLVSPKKTDATSALDLSINPYYDAGYDQGQEDGYHDGIFLSTLMKKVS